MRIRCTTIFILLPALEAFVDWDELDRVAIDINMRSTQKWMDRGCAGSSPNCTPWEHNALELCIVADDIIVHKDNNDPLPGWIEGVITPDSILENTLVKPGYGSAWMCYKVIRYVQDTVDDFDVSLEVDLGCRRSIDVRIGWTSGNAGKTSYSAWDWTYVYDPITVTIRGREGDGSSCAGNPFNPMVTAIRHWGSYSGYRAYREDPNTCPVVDHFDYSGYKRTPTISARLMSRRATLPVGSNPGMLTWKIDPTGNGQMCWVKTMGLPLDSDMSWAETIVTSDFTFVSPVSLSD